MSCKPNFERWEQFAAMRESGMTLQQIGDTVGCTRENVRQALKRHKAWLDRKAAECSNKDAPRK